MSLRSHFFAHLSRMKLITRWPLMRNVTKENVAEHSLQVAMVAHALATIKNKKFGGDTNPDNIAVKAMFHDSSEVLTGDLPSPVKYFNPDIKKEYKKIEKAAEEKLISMSPADLQSTYRSLIDHHQYSDEDRFLVKAADLICGYLKTLEELAAGNHEFEVAKRRILASIEDYRSPEVDYFLTTFADSFSLSLDEITQDGGV